MGNIVQNSDIKTDFKTLRITFDTPDRKYNCKFYDSIGGDCYREEKAKEVYGNTERKTISWEDLDCTGCSQCIEIKKEHRKF